MLGFAQSVKRALTTTASRLSKYPTNKLMLFQMNSRHIFEKGNQTQYLSSQSRAHVRE